MPVEAIARGLGIGEIRYDELDGCEGVLLTDRMRSHGSILVNTRRGLPSARFGVAHELGHFLLERHVLGLGGLFTCTLEDLRAAQTARPLQQLPLKLHQKQEVEANAFAIALLAPAASTSPFLGADPTIETAMALKDHLDLSFEAALRCLVERHGEPLAAVWSQDGTIRYVVRGEAFPWITRMAGQYVGLASRTAQMLKTGTSGMAAMAEVAPSAWTRADIPELFEQVWIGRDGRAVTLLWATLPETGND